MNEIPHGSEEINFDAPDNESKTSLINQEDLELISNTTENARELLEKTIDQDRGLIYTSGDPNSQFGKETWSRDTMFAFGTYIARENPQIAIKTLDNILSYQWQDGSLPVRIEYKRHWAGFIPPFRGLRKHGVDFISHDRYARAVFEDSALPSRDTAPSIIIGAGELFRSSNESRNFVASKYEQLKKALGSEENNIDEEDGLVQGKYTQDWADSIIREGKLADINILYYRALREMTFMSHQLNKSEYVDEYSDKAIKLKESILKNFWNEDGGYIKAGVEDDRIDVPANIFACLYLVDVGKTVRIQTALKSMATSSSGLLKNFDEPYEKGQILFRHKLGGISQYHNEAVWPWVTAENILAKIKIYNLHQNQEVRDRFAKEAVEDFILLSKIHHQNDNFYEVLNDQDSKPFDSKIFGMHRCSSSPHFLGSISSYLVAERELQKAHLIELEITK